MGLKKLSTQFNLAETSICQRIHFNSIQINYFEVNTGQYNRMLIKIDKWSSRLKAEKSSPGPNTQSHTQLDTHNHKHTKSHTHNHTQTGPG